MASRRSISASKVKKEMVDICGPVCSLCKTETDQIELDHIVPLWNGGTNDPDNLQLLCYDCHKAKSKSEQQEYNRMHPIIIVRDGVIVPGKGKYNG
jgi:5-methylcytosine-specific restriction endonuclease McrA